MKNAFLLLLLAALILETQSAFGQFFWRQRNGPPGRAGSAAPGAGGGTGFPTEDEINETRRPVAPPVGPGVPKYFTLTPVKVPSSRTPDARNFEAREDNFSSPQVVLHPDAFSGSEIRDLAFSPDGRHLAVAGDVVRIFDVESKELVHTLRGQREYGGIGGCTSIAYSPDGRYLAVAVAGHNTSLRVYDTTDLSEIKEVYGGHDGHIVRIAFSRDGRYLATAGVDHFIHVWDWPQRTKTKSYLVDGPVVHLDFPSEQDNVLAIIKLDQEWKLFYWSLSTDKIASEADRQVMYRLFHNSPPIERGHVHLHASEVHCESGYAILGIYDKTASGRQKFRCAVWNGQRIVAEYTHPYFVTAATYHPGRRLVATGDAVGQVHVWSVTTGDEIALFRSPSIGIFSVAFDGSSRLRFGRNPYQSGNDWRLNHYAALSHYVDLAEQKAGQVEPERAADGPSAVESLGDLRVRLGANKTLSVERSGRTVSSITYGRSTEYSPNTLGLLRDNDLGFTESAVVGFSNGTLTAYGPDNLQLKRTFLGHTGQVWAFSQSPNGRLMATASGDNTIRIWSLREGRHFGNLPVFVERDGTIYDLVKGTPVSMVLKIGDRVLKIDGKRLSDLADDLAATGQWPLVPGQRAVVEYESAGKVRETTIELADVGDIVPPLLSIKVAEDGRDWIAWTPRGYYASSSAGDRLIGWQENRGRDRAARFYYADQLRDRFDRPDIVLRALETADLDLAVQLANSDIPKPPPPVDIREDMPKVRPPSVRILSPLANERISAPEVMLRAEITGVDAASLKEVSVQVNGRTYVDRSFVVEPRPGDSSIILEKQIRVSPGENRISVSARSAAIGRSDVVRIICEPFEIERQLYAVALGVSDYANGEIRDLKYAADDAEQFIEAMKRQQELGSFSAVHSRLLVNDGAKRADAEAAISWLVENAKEEDVIVFFVAGHGLLDKANNYFLATHDANPNQPLLSCLNWRMMEYLVQGVPCRVLLFVDTCHAGGILGGKTMQRNPYRNLHSEELGAFVFAAASPGEPAFENGGNGLFTKALLSILGDPESDQDQPADHCLSYGELFLGLNQHMKNLSGQTQSPYIEKPQGLGKDITLFRLPLAAAD